MVRFCVVSRCEVQDCSGWVEPLNPYKTHTYTQRSQQSLPTFIHHETGPKDPFPLFCLGLLAGKVVFTIKMNVFCVAFFREMTLWWCHVEPTMWRWPIVPPFNLYDLWTIILRSPSGQNYIVACCYSTASLMFLPLSTKNQQQNSHFYPQKTLTQATNVCTLLVKNFKLGRQGKPSSLQTAYSDTVYRALNKTS